MTEHSSAHPPAPVPPGTKPSFHEPDGDVVPGDPPVPITVWHLPRPEPGTAVSAAVIRRLIVNHTAPGGTVTDLTTRPLSGPASQRLNQPADLIISGWPVDPPVSAEEYLAGCAAHLTTGGCLALVLSVTDTPDHLGDLVVAARSAGLTYLQHVVVAHRLGRTPAGPEIGHTPASPPTRADVETSRHRSPHIRVHSDILIFRRPGPSA